MAEHTGPDGSAALVAVQSAPLFNRLASPHGVSSTPSLASSSLAAYHLNLRFSGAAGLATPKPAAAADPVVSGGAAAKALEAATSPSTGTAQADAVFPAPLRAVASWSGLPAQSAPAPVLFNFDNAVLHSPLPIDLTESGITAHFSATGQGFSVQEANVLGFTPVGFSGYCLYPNSVFPADLMVGFSQTLVGFSILYAPEEYATDSSATMRVTAYMNGTEVGTNTATANPPGTWPTATLSFAATAGFNSVVVHYDSPPPTGGDYGPIFMADNMNVTPAAVPCFARGTLIGAGDGEAAVENLAIGDRVTTASGEAKPIKWIGRRSYDGRFIAGNKAVLPIRITAGALADGMPAHDLLVSPEHCLVIDGLFLPARLLTNGVTIRQCEDVDRLEYFHIELDSHDVIFAEGAAAETFLDVGGRGHFHNAGEFAQLYAGARPADWEGYAALLERGKAGLPAIRAALLARALALGRVSRDPDLHLIVNGAVVRAQSVDGGTHRFAVSGDAHHLTLASRSVVPIETEAASLDPRRLGVPLERLTVRGAGFCIEVIHDCPALSEGFHADEGSHRWTDGRAVPPRALFACIAGAVMIEVQIGATELHYPAEPPAVAKLARTEPCLRRSGTRRRGSGTARG